MTVKTDVKFWVSMTDTFLSGWGKANNKKNKLIFECNSYEQALIVATNADNRADQVDITIHHNKPAFKKQHYMIQVKTIEDYPCWYKAEYFAK